MGNYKYQHLIGQAGVLRVASELMFRGMHVLLPSVDTGVDLFIEGGIRIQVKTSTVVQSIGKASFRLAHGYRMGSNGSVNLDARTFSAECDFVVLYSSALNKFWIVPSPILDGLKSCTAGVGNMTLLSSTERDVIITLRNENWTWQQIADKYGVSPGLIRQVVKNPKYGQHKLSGRSTNSVIGQINEYEGQWGRIKTELETRMGNTIREVCHSFKLD